MEKHITLFLLDENNGRVTVYSTYDKFKSVLVPGTWYRYNNYCLQPALQYCKLQNAWGIFFYCTHFFCRVVPEKKYPMQVLVIFNTFCETVLKYVTQNSCAGGRIATCIVQLILPRYHKSVNLQNATND